MKLLKLTPEATRLRRMSRAAASGDISQSEYRAARRDIIAGFGQGPGSKAGRALIDETQRRQRSGDSSDGGEGVLRGGSDSLWWLVSGAAVTVLVVIVIGAHLF